MKRIVAIVFACALAFACVPVGSPVAAGLDIPESRAEFDAAIVANPAPGENGYIAARGSGPTVDAGGVERPYACYGFYNGRQIDFPCPADGVSGFPE